MELLELLKDADRRTISVSWPEEVDDHLETLIKILANAGTPISRSQLLAALVASATLDPQTLAEAVRAYLRRQAGDLRSLAEAEELPALRHPGPPRRKPTAS